MPALLPMVSADKVDSARGVWAPMDWTSIMLRIGPNYRKHRQKAATEAPLLPCVGLQLMRCESKVYSDGCVDLACMPPEVAAAAAEPTHIGSGPPPLPRFMIVTFCMPRYSGSAADGPTLRFTYVYAIPPELRSEPGAAAAMACEFFDGSASGHCDEESHFYDRFKVIARALQVDKPMGPFLRKMVQWFNAKPMLWRFFGVWGNCLRRGGVTFVNLDFCTGGRLKNRAFFEGLALARNTVVFDLAFTLEARGDDDMPERLLGGATACRLDFEAAPHVHPLGDGRFVPAVVDDDGSSFWRLVW